MGTGSGTPAQQLETRALLTVDYVRVADSLDAELVELQNRLTAALNAMQTGATSHIPIVGDQLGQAANIVSSFRNEIREAIEKFGTATPTPEQLQSALAEHLGSFLGLAGPEGVHVSDSGDTTTIEMILQGSAVLDEVDINFDTGLPSLPIRFTSNGSLELSVGYALEVAFTIHETTGVVELINGARNLTGVTAPDSSHPLVDNHSDLALFVSAGPSSDFSAKAVFGFVEGVATLLPGAPNGLHATVLVSDLLGTPSLRIDGSADANMKLAGSFAGSPDDFPGISTNFRFHWGLSSADPGFGAPTVSFDNVSLTFGTFLSNVLRPSLNPVKTALDPLSPILTLLSTEVPGISDLSKAGGAGPIRILDLAVLGSNLTGNGPLGELAGKITSLLAKIDSIQLGANISLPLGGFDLNSTTNGDLRSAVLAGDFKDLSLSSISPLSAANLNNLAQSASQSLSNLIDDLQISEDLKSELRGLNALKTQNGFQIGFPILNDPAGVVFNLLLGRDSDLFYFQADASAELQGTRATGLHFAGQPINLFGRMDLDTHLRFGYDTFGLRQLISNLAAGDASHIVSDITDGFYVNSDSYFKMAGAMGAEFGASVLNVFPVSISGGLYTQNSGLDPVHVYIEDPNADGKLRISEFHVGSDNKPAAFKLTGELAAELNVEVGFPDPDPLDILPPPPNSKLTVARDVLVRFSTLTPSRLASEPDANGEVTLFLGTHAHERAVGQNQDDGDEKFIIEHLRANPNGTEDIKVRAFGVNQVVRNVRRIRATDQVGRLTILVQPGVTSDVDFDGGTGAAFLTYQGSGIASLTGGALSSELTGGSGPSILVGHAGDDTIILGSDVNTVDAGGGNNTVIAIAPIRRNSVVSGGTSGHNFLKVIASPTTTAITATPVGTTIDLGIQNSFSLNPVTLNFSNFDDVLINASFTPASFRLGDLAAAGVSLLTLDVQSRYSTARSIDLETRIGNGSSIVGIRDYVFQVPDPERPAVRIDKHGAQILNTTTGLTTRLLGFHSDDTLTLRHHGGSIVVDALAFTEGHFVLDNTSRAESVTDVVQITLPGRDNGRLDVFERFRDVQMVYSNYSSFRVKGSRIGDQLNVNVSAPTSGETTVDVDAMGVHGELNLRMLGNQTDANHVTLRKSGREAAVSIFGQDTTTDLLLGVGQLSGIRHNVFASNVKLTVDNDESTLASILTLDASSFGSWNIPTLSGVTPKLAFSNLRAEMTVYAGAGDRFQLDVTPASITGLAIYNQSLIVQDAVYTSNWSVPLSLLGNFSFYAGQQLHRDGTIERVKRLVSVNAKVDIGFRGVGTSEVVLDADMDAPGANYIVGVPQTLDARVTAMKLPKSLRIFNQTVGLDISVTGYRDADRIYAFLTGANVDASLQRTGAGQIHLNGQARLTGTHPTAPNKITIASRYGSILMTPLGEFNSLLDMFNDVYILGAMPQDSLTVNMPTNVVMSPSIQHSHNLAINPNAWVEVVVPDDRVVSWQSGNRPFGFPFRNVDAVSWDQHYAPGAGNGDAPNPFGELPYGIDIPGETAGIEVTFFDYSVIDGAPVLRKTRIEGFARYWTVDAVPAAEKNDVRLNASQLRGDFSFNIAPPDYDFVRRLAQQSLPLAITQSASYNAPFWTWGGASSESTRVAFGQSDIVLSHVNPELTVDIDGGSSPFDYRTTINQGQVHRLVVSPYAKTHLNVGGGVLANLKGNITADQVELEVDDRLGTRRNIIGMNHNEISWFDADNTRTTLGLTQLRNNLILTGGSVDHIAIEGTPELFEDDVIERGPSSNTLIVDVPEIVTIRNFAPADVSYASPDVYLMGHRANQPLNVVGNLDLFVGRRLRTDGVVEAVGDLAGVTEFTGATAVHRINYTYTGSGRGQLVYDGSSFTTPVRAASIQTDASEAGRGALHFGYADFTQEIFFPSNSLNAVTFGGNTSFSVYAPIRGFERRQLSGYGLEIDSTSTAAISYFTNPLQAALEIDQVSIFAHQGPVSVFGRGSGTRVMLQSLSNAADLRTLITGDVAISNAAVKITSTNAGAVSAAAVPITLTRTQVTGLTGGMVTFAGLANTTNGSSINPGLSIGLPHYGATSLTISGTPDGAITAINTVNNIPIGPTNITGTNGELWLGPLGSDVNPNSDPRLEFRTSELVIGDGDLDGIKGAVFMGDNRLLDFAPGGVTIDNHLGTAVANAAFGVTSSAYFGDPRAGAIKLLGLAPASIHWKPQLTTPFNVIGSAGSQYTVSYVSTQTRLFAGSGSRVDTTTVANSINNLNGLTIFGAAAVHVDARSAELTTPIQVIPDPARPAEIVDLTFDSANFNATYFLDTTNTGLGRIGNSSFSQASPGSFVLYKPENTRFRFQGLTTSPEQYFSEINVVGTPALFTSITPGNLRVNVAATTNPVEIHLTSSALLTLGSTGDMHPLAGRIDITAQNPASVPAAIRFNSSADPAPRTVTLSQLTSDEWSVSGMTTVPQLISGSSFTLSLDGGAGANTLVGPDVVSTWLINGTNSGKLNQTVTFTGMKSIVSGFQNDTILFKPTGSLAGNLDGGAGFDTLYYQNGMLTGADIINLPSQIAPRVTGHALNLESSSSFGVLAVTNPGDQQRQIAAPIVPIPIVTAGGFGTKRFTATGLPDGISMNSQTGLLTGTPLTENQSTFITVTVADDSGSASVGFFWHSQPGLYIVPMFRQTVNVNVPVAIQIQAPYTYGGTLTFSATDLPPGLTINSATGMIGGTVADGTELTNPFVSSNVTVTDGTHTVSQFLSFNVIKTRLLLNPGPQRTPDGLPISLTMQLVNAVGTVTWTAFGLPGGVVINSQTGVISGAFPQFSFSRQYSITVQASTPSGSSSVQFTWQTGGGFVPTGIHNRSSKVAEHVFDVISFSNNISFSTITVAVTGLPPGLTHNGFSISGQLDLYADHGSAYHPTVTYTNHTYNYSFQTTFDWTIIPAIVLGTPAAPSSNPRDIVDLLIPVLRDLRNPLTFTANNLPDGLSIDPQTGHVTGTVESLPYGATFRDVSITGSDPVADSSSTVSFRWFVNSTPFILLSNTTIDENSAAGTVLGALSLAESLTGPFWLSDDYGVFELASDGVTIIVREPTYLNYEYYQSFNLEVYFQITEEFSASRRFTILVTDISEAPAEVTLTNVIETLQEDASTVAATRLADIEVSDEDGGNNLLTLGGPDAGFFRIVNSQLYLKSSVRLNFANKPTYAITINVDDPAVGSSPDLMVSYTLNLTSTAPTMVTTSAPTPDMTPTITWSAIPGATSYDVWITNLSTNSVLPTQTVTGTSYTPSSDLGIGRFRVWVRSQNAANVKSRWSASLTFVINTAVTMNPIELRQITARPDISWRPLSGATRYEIWISSSTVSGFVYRNDTLIGTSWRPESDLAVGRYRAWIRGFAADGTPGTWSQELTQMIVVPAPTLITASTPTQDMTPTISWPAVPGAVNYEVWITNLSTNTALPVQLVASPSYTPTADLGIGRFRVWVRLSGPASYKSPWSTPYNLTINTAVTLDPVVRRQNTARPQISWQLLPGATRYEVHIKSPSISGFLLREAEAGTTWTPSNDLAVGRYQAWVRGYSADGTAAAWSREISMIADFIVVPAPTLISPLHATFDRTPAFTWTSVTGAAHYILRVRNSNTGVVVMEQTVTATSFTSDLPFSDGPYNWEVRSVGPLGHQSSFSPSNRLYVGGRPVISGPIGNTSLTEPTFLWSAVQDASQYELRVDRTDTVQNRLIARSDLTSTSFKSTVSLAVGTYRFWVRAVSVTGEFSPWSLVSNFAVVAIEEGGSRPLSEPADILFPTILSTNIETVSAGESKAVSSDCHGVGNDRISPTTHLPDEQGLRFAINGNGGVIATGEMPRIDREAPAIPGSKGRSTELMNVIADKTLIDAVMSSCDVVPWG